MGFDSVFLIVSEPIETDEHLKELVAADMNEDEMRQKVLNAHKVLMEMNEYNHDQFKDLVSALENDVHDDVSSKAG